MLLGLTGKRSLASTTGIRVERWSSSGKVLT
jgi:hypothetical protein